MYVTEYGVGVLRDKRQDGLYDPTDDRHHGGQTTSSGESRHRKYFLVRGIDGNGKSNSDGQRQSKEMLPIVKELTTRHGSVLSAV